MKSENANFTHEYNSALDILYLMLDKTEESYGHEDDYGVVLNYDYATKKLVGIDIWDFKERFQEDKQIPLPIEVDLKSIYSSLPK